MASVTGACYWMIYLREHDVSAVFKALYISLRRMLVDINWLGWADTGTSRSIRLRSIHNLPPQRMRAGLFLKMLLYLPFAPHRQLSTAHKASPQQRLLLYRWRRIQWLVAC